MQQGTRNMQCATRVAHDDMVTLARHITCPPLAAPSATSFWCLVPSAEPKGTARARAHNIHTHSALHPRTVCRPTRSQHAHAQRSSPPHGLSPNALTTSARTALFTPARSVAQRRVKPVPGSLRHLQMSPSSHCLSPVVLRTAEPTRRMTPTAVARPRPHRRRRSLQFSFPDDRNTRCCHDRRRASQRHGPQE